MEAKTIGFNFLGQNWTAEFNYQGESPVAGATMTSEKTPQKLTCIVGKKSLDEDDKAELKRNLITSLILEVLVAKYGKFVLIDKNGEKSSESGKLNWENVLDGDLLYTIAEYNEEIQSVANELLKQMIDYAATL